MKSTFSITIFQKLLSNNPLAFEHIFSMDFYSSTKHHIVKKGRRVENFLTCSARVVKLITMITSINRTTRDKTSPHSFHISANSSASNGFAISCIFLLVLAFTFLAYLPAAFLFSSARICTGINSTSG